MQKKETNQAIVPSEVIEVEDVYLTKASLLRTRAAHQHVTPVYSADTGRVEALEIGRNANTEDFRIVFNASGLFFNAFLTLPTVEKRQKFLLKQAGNFMVYKEFGV